ncbi:hypothetical protein AM571_PC01891 (plasmid) [Rhizobium etli 8C-3]|uniref:Uncharacterized protein n=1 Tax=Rhizobium etli 8C-3 TaxID=538025 RepID=A0A1L5PHF5_RHIET|nr:hypothetical protein AM571_PC01891 [Rhizobium etli 8C-3]
MPETIVTPQGTIVTRDLLERHPARLVYTIGGAPTLMKLVTISGQGIAARLANANAPPLIPPRCLRAEED